MGQICVAFSENLNFKGDRNKFITFSIQILFTTRIPSPSLHTLHDFEHTLGTKFDARRTDTFKNDFTYSIDLFIHYSNTYLLRRRKIPAVFCRDHMMTVVVKRCI